MSEIELLVISPLLVLAGAVVVVMLVAAFVRRSVVTAVLTLVGLVAAFAMLFLVWSEVPRQVTPLLVMDGYAIFYLGLLLATAFVVVVQGYGYWRAWSGDSHAFYILLLLATLGTAVLVTSSHFASFFLGLELLSISLYGLIAYTRQSKERVEAGLKYLILAGTTSAFLLFGMALIYAELGTMQLAEIGAEISAVPRNLIFIFGIGLLLVGIAFKLALVPFHLWTPDVYQGAPAPVTGFVATVSKGGMFVLLLRYFGEWELLDDGRITGGFTIIAIASMLVGNLLAVRQDNVKRILAYSSIAHLGYLLIPFIAFNEQTMQAAAFYLVAYFVTTLCAFGVVALLSRPEEEREALSDYAGLFWQRPYLSTVFMLALLSLAGLPPLAGLVGKIYLALAGIESGLWLLLVVLVLASLIGVYYYTRIILVMVRRVEGEGEGTAVTATLSSPAGVVLVLLALLLVVLGLYPSPLIELITAIIPGLT
ncbi:MAG: NADH-quinone oxidoreductase subunit N [Anaerolineaceae bacterium]|nr:NADH-quinone oxidoreductase subunit N [Anaerolineaceae bacterium]